MATFERDTALTTQAKVKAFLTGFGGTGEDDRIASLIISCSEDISEFCDRKFAQATYTHYLDGTGTQNLWLTHWPITAPLSSAHSGVGDIWVDGNQVFADSDKLTEQRLGYSDNGEFFVKPDEEQGLVLRKGGAWPKGDANIKATYQAGYSTIPKKIENAANELVAYRLGYARTNAHDVSSITTVTGDSRTYLERSSIPIWIRKSLRSWVKVRLPYG